MNLDRYQVQNLWEQINRTNKKQIAVGMDISENWTFLFLFFPTFFVWLFWKTKYKKMGIFCYGGSANYWAELDLNQRRHIANEFTVRPH